VIDENSIIQSDIEQLSSSALPWHELANKRVMVTGGGGFLAAYLVKTLLNVSKINNLNIKVIVISRRESKGLSRLFPYRHFENLEIISWDVSSPLPAHFPKSNFVIHSASQASPVFFETDPVGTLKANSVGTMHLLDYSIRSDAEKFLFFSSGEVYGQLDDTNKEISELDYGYLDPAKLRSCYAESKRLGETMSIAWSHQYGVNTSIVRPFHTYGPGMALDDGRVFADFVSDAVSRRDIVIRSNGLARRPFCYITDATRGFFTVLFKGESQQAYNIANPSAEVSIRELAEEIARIFPERALRIRFEGQLPGSNYLKSPITRQMPNIDKAKSLGWNPEVGISKGFERTILSYD
jgi:UDP-glucuronate decarboxylase